MRVGKRRSSGKQTCSSVREEVVQTPEFREALKVQCERGVGGVGRRDA